MKTHLLFFLFTFLITNAFSQFEEAIIIDHALNASVRNIITLDVDNDHLKDIVVSSYFNDVFWYKNNGTGFNLAQSISMNIPVPYHLDRGDVNSDGFVDILVTNNNGNSSGSFVLINNNGGQSWTEIELDNTLLIGAFRSFFIDIDQDGDLDVVSNGDTKMVMYTNDGMGSFSSVITIENMNEYYSMAVGDFTNDTFDDLMVNSATSGTILFTNNTNGSFSNPTSMIEGLSITIHADDIDRDGDLDLFRSDPNSALGFQYLTNNDGIFNLSYNLDELNPNDLTSAEFHLNDLNNDTFSDILFINSENIYWKANQQDGNFANSDLIEQSFSFKNIYADDIDNDGDQDIIWFGWDLSSDTEIYNLGIIKNNTSLGIERKSMFKNLKVSPNPSHSIIHITSSSDIEMIDIFNLKGQKVVSTDQTTIDISSLENGLYFLKLHNTNTKSINRHFIKN